MGRESPIKLVKAHENAELVKGPRKPKEKTSSQTRPLGERVNGWPKEVQQD